MSVVGSCWRPMQREFASSLTCAFPHACDQGNGQRNSTCLLSNDVILCACSVPAPCHIFPVVSHAFSPSSRPRKAAPLECTQWASLKALLYGLGIYDLYPSSIFLWCRGGWFWEARLPNGIPCQGFEAAERQRKYKGSVM